MTSEQVQEAVEFVIELEIEHIISPEEADRRLEMVIEETDEDLFLMWQ